MVQTEACRQADITMEVPPHYLEYNFLPGETDVIGEAQAMQNSFRHIDIDVADLWKSKKDMLHYEVVDTIDELHTVATLSYVAFAHALAEGNKIKARAAALIFNRTTQQARKYNEQYDIFDKAPIQKFIHRHVDIALREQQSGVSLSEAHAQALGQTAEETKHEDIWAYLMLPAVASQPYGRILLAAIEHPGTPYKSYLTQSFFLPGQKMLAHTHANNRGFSAPLRNAILKNIQWGPHSPDKLFPIEPYEELQYSSQTGVVEIPPRTIHTIERVNGHGGERSFKQLIESPKFRNMVLELHRIGEKAALHLYAPDVAHLRGNHAPGEPQIFANSPFDMLVLSQDGIVYAAEGGAHDPIMTTFGKDGAHCNACVREDIRRDPVAEQTVLRWFVSHNQQGAIVHAPQTPQTNETALETNASHIPGSTGFIPRNSRFS